jgi:hypothetical protein
MRKSLLYAALIAALAVFVCGGTLANPQEEAVAQTSGGVGQFKGQCLTAGTTLNDPIVKPYYDDPTTAQTEYTPTADTHQHNFSGAIWEYRPIPPSTRGKNSLSSKRVARTAPRTAATRLTCARTTLLTGCLSPTSTAMP